METVEIDEFLSRKPRLGTLVTLRKDGSPTAAPVWFEWTGSAVRLFTETPSTKLTRIANDPRASFIVANDVGEPEAWVAFDGLATVSDAGGIELAEKLAPLYWNLDDPGPAEILAAWRAAAESFRLISIEPTTIRSFP